VDRREFWLNVWLKHIRDNFLHTKRNDAIAKFLLDITFWKRDKVKGVRVKTLSLLDITVQFGRIA
jgi:hypothetical protein